MFLKLVWLMLFLLVGLNRALAGNMTITLGGSEQLAGGNWDTGSISISFSDTNGHTYTETVAYGQFSTPNSLAAGIAGKFSRDYSCSSGVATGFAARVGTGSAGQHVVTFTPIGGCSFSTPTIVNPSVAFTLTVSDATSSG